MGRCTLWWYALLLVALVLVLSFAHVPARAQSGADWDIPYGHVFTQTAAPGAEGYVVADDGQAAFWTAFRDLGGVTVVGYPISRRLVWDGFVSQAFQKLVLQWRPELNGAAFVNVFDELSKAGKDGWLEQERQVPRPTSPAQPGDSWEVVVAKHLALLDGLPALRAFYLSTPRWLDRYGLPVSAGDFGPLRVVRAQRMADTHDSSESLGDLC